MAVLRSQRNIAETEFENTFSTLYKLSIKNTIAIAKRRKRWLVRDIDAIMNEVYIDVMYISEDNMHDKSANIQHRKELALEAATLLSSLEAPLMVLWNVAREETRKMAIWVELINRELYLLNRIHQSEEDINMVRILDYETINKAEFLRKMSILHRYTHDKVTNAKKDYDSTEGEILIKLVNDAFYSVIQANRKIPETQNEYIARRQHLSRAISNLRSMNRHLLFYFNLMHYSENTMKEWSGLLGDEMALLIGLQKSDKERFGKLE